jgi:hypothetical protein
MTIDRVHYQKTGEIISMERIKKMTRNDRLIELLREAELRGQRTGAEIVLSHFAGLIGGFESLNIDYFLDNSSEFIEKFNEDYWTVRISRNKLWYSDKKEENDEV